MERIQIFLSQADRQALEKLARDSRISMSAVVRELIREHVKLERRAALRAAAGKMADAYRHDRSLTGLGALDGDDFLITPTPD